MTALVWIFQAFLKPHFTEISSDKTLQEENWTELKFGVSWNYFQIFFFDLM